MVRATIFAAGVFLSLFSINGLLASEESNAPIEELKQNLTKLYPNTSFNSIRQSVYPGMFEIIMGRNAVYTDVNGRYFTFGHVFDMRDQKDLTEARLSELNRISFEKLPATSAIVFKEGNGSRRLAVFSDPDCPYCRKLEPELAKLKDVIIYLYMMPLSIHPDAMAKAESVWCAKDRASSWRELMTNNKVSATDKCETPIPQIVALAKQMNISGTPTLVSGDGRVQPGAMSAQAIDNWLNAGEKK